MSADPAGALETEMPGDMLTGGERRALGVRLILSVAACGFLVVAVGLRLLFPDETDVAELVAGIAAALVAVPALADAWHSLRHPDLHGVTDQLIALALIAAWASGDLLTAALLPLLMTVGHILEERSLLGSREAIRALGRLTRTRARRLRENGEAEEVAAGDLAVGDRIELRAGEIVPADGIVESGAASLDTASLTGESVPAEVRPGLTVLSGSIDLDGLLVVRVTGVGTQTTLGRVVSLLQEAERSKPPVTRLLEAHAGKYIVLSLLLAAGVWFVTGSSTAMLAVLVAACPCALVLAAPATAVAAIAVASRHGILVKGAAFLESLATLDTVVFDKTGTLTLGELRLIETLPAEGVDPTALVALAAALGAGSNHPVSQALAALRGAQDTVTVDQVSEARGFGVVGRADGEAVQLGRAELLSEQGVDVPALPTHDGPIAGVARGGRFQGWLLFADQPRPEAMEAIADLRRLGLTRQMLLTGDRAPVAERVAATLGLTGFAAEALPDDKMRFVLDEIAAGRRPLVVGDGINDSLALKAGAVGVAMGAKGTDVALASADLVLMTSDLRRLGTSIRLSRQCRRTIYVNVGIGLGWTLVMIAAAAGGFLGAGGALIVAILHNVSTLVVMGNAGRLLKFQE